MIPFSVLNLMILNLQFYLPSPESCHAKIGTNFQDWQVNMATDSIRKTRPAVPEALFEGNRLDQPTFHRLYEQTPPGFKAELIGGIVHVASPLRVTHGRFHTLLMTWLANYMRATPGTDVLDGATVILGDESEPQPDACLRFEHGASRVSEDDYCVGPPELLIEVSHSTVTKDLVHKRDDYERNNVGEYLVLVIPESRAIWFVRGKEGDFVELSPIDGKLQSRIFPGLRLDAEAFFQRDYGRVMTVLNEGLASIGKGDG